LRTDVRKVFGVSFGVGANLPVPSLKLLKQSPTLKATVLVLLCNMDPVCIVSCIREEHNLDPGKAKPPLITRDRLISVEVRKMKRTKLLCSYHGLDLRQSTLCNRT
jgi:hypothetical protein